MPIFFFHLFVYSVFFFGPLLLLLLFALMLMLYTVYIIFYLLFFEWTEMFFPSSSQEKKNCSHFQFTVVFSSFTKKREKIIAPLGHYCAETNCYNNTESSTLILKYFNEFAYFAFCYFALCFSNFIVGNAHLHSTHKTSDTTTKLKWMKQKPSSEWQWNMFFFWITKLSVTVLYVKKNISNFARKLIKAEINTWVEVYIIMIARAVFRRCGATLLIIFK